MDITRERRLDDQHYWEFPALSRPNLLLGKTETFEFLDMKTGALRPKTRNRLGLKGNIRCVFQVKYDMNQFAGVNVAFALPRSEFPGNITPRIGIEFQNDGSRLVDLSVDHGIGFYHQVDAGNLANLLVKGNQCVTKTEHQQRNHGKFAKRFTVTSQKRLIHWNSRRRSKNPKKNAAAIVASTIPVFTFRFSFCSGCEWVIEYPPGKR